MRIRTNLRQRREAAGLSVRGVYAATGVAIGDVSLFERGNWIPRDEQATQLAAVYGPRSTWYPPSVARVLLADLRDCGGCGEELDPDASGARRYHSDACRVEAYNRRRRKHGDALPSPLPDNGTAVSGLVPTTA